MKKIAGLLHHLFVPHHTNNYTAKLLHHSFLTLYLLIAISATGIIHTITSSRGDILGYATDVTVQKLYDLTNNERSKYNLKSLDYNVTLASAAEKKAADMFAQGYWAHYGPKGETPWDFILGSGYQYEYAGENLAKNFLFSGDVVSAWMNSPSHKENIVRPEYSEVGLAVVNGVLNGEETTLVVQMFGSPLYPVGGAPKKQEDLQKPTIPAENQVQTEMQQIKLAQEKASVLSQGSQNKKSYFPVYFNLNMLFMVIFMVALIIDFYVAERMNLVRIKGKNLVHFIFVGFIVFGAYILIKGSIS